MSITFLNFPLPLIKRSFSAEANTSGWILLFFSTSRAHFSHSPFQPLTHSALGASRSKSIRDFFSLPSLARAFCKRQVLSMSSWMVLFELHKTKLAKSFFSLSSERLQVPVTQFHFLFDWPLQIRRPPNC